VAGPVRPIIQLLPRFYQQEVRISWKGVSHVLPEMLRTVKMVSVSCADSGVSNVAAHLGRAIWGSDRQCDAAQIWVKLIKLDYDATLTAINQTIDEYPGLEHET
jgi:hypothetical protein